MTREELYKRLTDIEWDDFEVKEAKSELPKSIWETVSAFSNTSGGWIVLGIQQKGKEFIIKGVDNAEKLEQDFTTTLRNNTKFNTLIFCKIQIFDIEGKKVLCFYIPSSSVKPVYFGGNVQNTFIRSGSGDQRAKDMEIASIFREQSFGTKSEQTVEGTSMNDLDLNSLKTYRDYVKTFNPTFLYNSLSDKDFCTKTNILRDGRLTYGGILMFGKYDNLRAVMNNFWIDYIEIPANSYSEASVRYSYRMPEQANIWESYNVIAQRLRVHVDAPLKMGPSWFAPEDESLYNAIREGFINMIAHADYFSPMHPTIRKYDNRIEFQNPGRFIFDLKELKSQMHSMPRNPNIIKFFRYAKLAENGGYGIDKMFVWETYKNQSLVFQNDVVCTNVVYRFSNYNVTEKNVTVNTPEGTENNNSDTQNNENYCNIAGDDDTANSTNNEPVNDIYDKVENIIEKTNNKELTNITNNTENTNDTVNDTVNNITNDTVNVGDDEIQNTISEKRIKLIMFLISNDPKITIDEITELLNASKITIRRDLQKLQKQNKLMRIGADKNGYWKIIVK